VLAGAREPLISQIKLAWWRDSLEKLDREKGPPEPVLQEVAAHVLPTGVSGTLLSAMEEGWAVLLAQEALSADDLAVYAAGRGGLLFRYSGVVLGGELSSDMEKAGEAWALVDLARHSNETDAAAAMDAAASRLHPFSWPSRLRPLGMLAVLAARDVDRGLEDFEEPGSPGRMLRMLRHRLGGG